MLTYTIHICINHNCNGKETCRECTEESASAIMAAFKGSACRDDAVDHFELVLVELTTLNAAQ